MESSGAVCLARLGRNERVCGAGESLDRSMAASDVRYQTRGLPKGSRNHRACELQVPKCLGLCLMKLELATKSAAAHEVAPRRVKSAPSSPSIAA